MHLPQRQYHQPSKNDQKATTFKYLNGYNPVAITSVTTNKKVGNTICHYSNKVGTIMTNISVNNNNIIKSIIPHTPSKVGVLLRKTFSYTPDEARSVG